MIGCARASAEYRLGEGHAFVNGDGGQRNAVRHIADRIDILHRCLRIRRHSDSAVFFEHNAHFLKADVVRIR